MQIFINYLTIFILPLIIGFVCRFVFRKDTRGWIISALFGLVFVILLLVAIIVPNHGNEAAGLFAIEAFMAVVSSVITGAVIRRKSKPGKAKK